MKKHLKNVFVKAGKKNRIAILICVVILTAGLGTLLGYTLVKGNTEAVSGQTETEDTLKKDPQTEDTQADELSSQSIEPLISDASVFIEDIVISLYENKQNIAAKLNETDLRYEEMDYNELPYNFDFYNKYDSSYYIYTPLESDWMMNTEPSLEVYFKNDICVRLRLIDEVPKTFRGIHKDAYSSDAYSQLLEKYGDSFEKFIFAAHGIYCVYLYSFDDYICEFMILEDYPDHLCNVDIYVSGLYPIYTHEEELTEEDLLEYRCQEEEFLEYQRKNGLI